MNNNKSLNKELYRDLLALDKTNNESIITDYLLCTIDSDGNISFGAKGQLKVLLNAIEDCLNDVLRESLDKDSSFNDYGKSDYKLQ